MPYSLDRQSRQKEKTNRLFERVVVCDSRHTNIPREFQTRVSETSGGGGGGGGGISLVRRYVCTSTQGKEGRND